MQSIVLSPRCTRKLDLESAWQLRCIHSYLSFQTSEKGHGKVAEMTGAPWRATSQHRCSLHPHDPSSAPAWAAGSRRWTPASFSSCVLSNRLLAVPGASESSVPTPFKVPDSMTVEKSSLPAPLTAPHAPKAPTLLLQAQFSSTHYFLSICPAICISQHPNKKQRAHSNWDNCGRIYLQRYGQGREEPEEIRLYPKTTTKTSVTPLTEGMRGGTVTGFQKERVKEDPKQAEPAFLASTQALLPPFSPRLPCPQHLSIQCPAPSEPER